MDEELMTQVTGLVAKVDDVLNGDEGLDAVRAAAKEAKESAAAVDDRVKKIEDMEIVEGFEKLKASHDALVKRIENTQTPGNVLGVDKNKFSLQRAMTAIRHKDFGEAGYEKEVMDAARKSRMQSIGNDAAGGFFVPDSVLGDVIGAIYKRSAFINLAGEGQTRVTVMEGLTTPEVTIPVFKGGGEAYWMSEADKYRDLGAKVGRINMSAKKLGAIVPMTKEALTFTAYGFEQLIRNNLVEALASKIDWTVPYGTGVGNMPRGVAYHPEVKVFSAEQYNSGQETTVYANAEAARTAKAAWGSATLAHHDPNFDVLDEMRGVLEDDDIDIEGPGSAFVFSPKVKRFMKKLKISNFNGQTDSQAYLLGMPILPDSRLTEALGPFATTTHIANNKTAGQAIGATTANTGSQSRFSEIFFGDWRQVMLARWGGLMIEDDGGRGLGFADDITYIKAGLYADIAIGQPRSLIFCPDIRTR